MSFMAVSLDNEVLKSTLLPKLSQMKLYNLHTRARTHTRAHTYIHTYIHICAVICNYT